MNEAATGTPGDAYDEGNVAGNALRHARESAGLSIDAVSQQLKLAPRQVRALEEGNYAELPGRTFVRGFSRNYAKLVNLDPEAVVAALPDANHAPSLDKPAIGASHRPMGELPDSEPAKGGIARWLIPLVLIALVGVAIYEYTRAPGEKLFSQDVDAPPAAGVPAPADPVMPPPMPGNGDATSLPNPLLPGDALSSVAGGESSTGTTAPAGATGDPPSAVSASGLLSGLSAAAPPPALPGDATLMIAYRGAAWTEVRDANGQRLLLLTGTPGTSQSVTGKPPFDLVLGNASSATVTWRGNTFDLAPHIQKNIARVRLP